MLPLCSTEHWDFAHSLKFLWRQTPVICLHVLSLWKCKCFCFLVKKHSGHAVLSFRHTIYKVPVKTSANCISCGVCGQWNNSLHKISYYGTRTKSRIAKYISYIRPSPNGQYFADDVLKCIFLNDHVCILITISLRYVYCVTQRP